MWAKPHAMIVVCFKSAKKKNWLVSNFLDLFFMGNQENSKNTQPTTYLLRYLMIGTGQILGRYFVK